MITTNLRCEYRTNPLGIDTTAPRLSWEIVSDRFDVLQKSYRIQVAGLPDWAALVWDSGEVASDRISAVRYEGPPLDSFTRYFWRVRATDNSGETSPWSATCWWETAVLDRALWSGGWISPPEDNRPGTEDAPRPAAYLRREFRPAPHSPAAPAIRSARIYASAHGVYDLFLNGRRISEDLFPPGFTSYDHRVQYQTYDVTSMILPGGNTIIAVLTDGWYRGAYGIGLWQDSWGTRTALSAMVRITYEDGTVETVPTDASWFSADGPVKEADLFYGEVYDARVESAIWSAPQWENAKPVSVLPTPDPALVAAVIDLPRVREKIEPVSVRRLPANTFLIDMGRVFAGQVEVDISAPAGTVITLKFVETLSATGEFLENQFDASDEQRKKGRFIQVDRYIASGSDGEMFRPRYTYHGYRYVLIEGYPGTFSAEQVRGLEISTPLPETGTFECSEPALNRLHRNILQSLRSNFIEIPTDCPQREKAGWTGDIQVFARTGLFLTDSVRFLTKWLADLRLDQKHDGLVPHTIPSNRFYESLPTIGIGGSAGWGDAAVTVPWTIYQVTGDRSILQNHYQSMKAWVEFIRARAPGHIWKRGFHWGDWLEPGRGFFYYMHTPFPRKDVIATAFYAWSARLLGEAAGVLGYHDDERRYRELATAIKLAFRRRFVRSPGAGEGRRSGRIRPHRQGSYVIALAFDLLEPEDASRAADHLARLVQKAGNHLATGFLTTPWLLWALARNGYEQTAMEVLLQRTYPSWLYAVDRGATTLWEAWDAIAPDGKVRAGISLNHYAFGAVGDFLYRYIAGLDSGEAGYTRIRFAPHPSPQITSARATYHSIHGPIGIVWRTDDDRLTVTVDVPPNTRAKLIPPDGYPVFLETADTGNPSDEGSPAAAGKGPSPPVLFGSGRRTFVFFKR